VAAAREEDDVKQPVVPAVDELQRGVSYEEQAVEEVSQAGKQEAPAAVSLQADGVNQTALLSAAE